MRRTLVQGIVCLLVAVAVAAASAAGLARAASTAPAGSPSPSPSTQAAVFPLASSDAPLLAVAGIPFKFRAEAFPLRELPIEERPGSGRHVTGRVDHGIHDADGVRMRVFHGKLYEFPRGQSAYGLANLNSYRISGDQFYLDRALAQADRLVSYHTEARGAWYFPTYPSRSRHGRNGEWIRAPYYSALSEGRVLEFFARLSEVTGLPKWRDAADHVFGAFLRPGPCSGPYVLDVDADGYYWLQEWPWPSMQPDDTFNGHNTSSYGLYEYYVVTHDERAAALFRGALTTVKHYLPSFRRPGWISCYCLLHRDTNANYHGMHIGQLLKLYKMTGTLLFARAADAFMSDYPRPRVRGGLRVEPGSYRAFHVDASGAVTGRRTVTVSSEATWRTSERKRLWPRSPICIRADSGPAEGWWLAERPGRVFLLGIAEQLNYAPARKLAVAGGQSPVAVQFDALGGVTARQRVDSGDGLTLRVDARAVIDGCARVRVSAGDLAGYWIQLRAGVRLI